MSRGCTPASTINSVCNGPQPTPTETFSLATTDVVLEVDYAPNALPYVGDAKPLDDVWTITQSNLERLLPGKTVRTEAPCLDCSG